jgi:copper transport protein
VLALAAAVLPAAALAHAQLIGSDPADGALLATPPTHLTLTFTEAVEPVGVGVLVAAPSGRPASRGAARARGRELTVDVQATEVGTYLVRWQVIAEDAHPSRGDLTFSLGHRGPVPTQGLTSGDLGGASPLGVALQALGRWLHFLGLALGFGTIAYLLLVLPEAAPEVAGRLERLALAGVGLMLAAEPLSLAGAAVGLQVGPGDLLVSSFGLAMGLRLGGALLLWASLGAVRQAGRGRAALLGLGAAAVLADQLSTHRLPAAPLLATYLLGGVHEGAMVVWVGGIAAWIATRAGGKRFVAVASLCLAVLVPSGVALAFAHVSLPGDLLGSAYGISLAVKALMVAVAVLLAALGRRRLEAVAVSVVLALAALLLSLPPPG